MQGSGERWRIAGGWRAADRQLCNEFLSYLADRRYSPASVRGYAFDLLHFARWLAGQGAGLDGVNTDTLLRYLAACRGRAPRRPARQRDLAGQRPGIGVRPGHRQPAAGGGLGPVQLPVDARPGGG